MRSKEIEKYKLALKLNLVQREVLIGLLLGDGHLETQNNGRTYRLKIEQSIHHKEYVYHLYDLFKEWVLTPPKEKIVRSTQSININFQTLSHPAFRFYAHQFYTNKEKRIPLLIHRWLTPRALSYWFMDDGSFKSSSSRGLILNTQSFSLKEIRRLITILQKNYNLISKERKQKDGYQIYISGHSYDDFVELVDSYLIISMRYKLQFNKFNKNA